MVELIEGKSPSKCNACNSIITKNQGMKSHVESVHDKRKPFKCEKCDGKSPSSLACNVCNSIITENQGMKSHVNSVHDKRKPFKCEKCGGKSPLRDKQFLRISSLNIGRGLFKKEELLANTIYEQECDICSVSEVDIEDFDENRPFTIKGYDTYFPLHRTGSNRKRLLCFVKASVVAKQRNDLMSNFLSNVWLEIKGINQKILICVIYRVQ